MRYLFNGDQIAEEMNGALLIMVRRAAKEMGDNGVITKEDAIGFVAAYGLLIDIYELREGELI